MRCLRGHGFSSMADPIRFQHYEVCLRADGSPEELGRGAMGVTYKAFDTNLRCHVALKVISDSYLGSEVARQRFLREARSAAGLRHPNVAAVYHLGESGGELFYAMEFVEGETVESLMKRNGPLPAPQALEIVVQVARALAAAEKQTLVHRDIKPANLMVVAEDARTFCVKMIDFGLAKSAAGDGPEAATLTVGGFLGTPHFASPEQLEEKELDVRSDIYSLGVTLFYMLAGRAPFGGTIAQVMSQHLHREPPLEVLGTVPEPVAALLRRMLAKDPAQRPQTAAELRQEVEACLQALGPGAVEPLAATVVGDSNFATQEMATRAPVVGSVPAELPSQPINEAPKKSPVALVVGVALAAVAAGGAGLVFFRPAPEVAVASATPVPTPAATPEPTPLPTPEATPTPEPTPEATPEATPDPVLEALTAANRLSVEDPAGGLTALLALRATAPTRADVRKAIEGLLAHIASTTPPADETVQAALAAPLAQAAEADFAAAQFLVAERLRPSDPQAALEWYSKAAEARNSDAMVNVGQMLAGGRGVAAPRLPEAAEWFSKAADLGNPKAKFLLAECFFYSKGVTRDPKRAVELLRSAADAGDPGAMNMLGDLSARGVPGVLAIDRSEAKELFERASAAGHADAQANLGALTMSGGPGFEPDQAKAVEIFRDGAENKAHPGCMYFLAVSYEEGLGGLEKSPALAKEWYVKAAAAGHPKALAWCREKKVPVPAAPKPVP